MHGLLWSSFVFFAAAVIAVPITKRLGFSSVLGYLIAGFLIGPSVLRVITNVDDIMHFSEFGVVLLLFVIGLELDIKKLWRLRMQIFGMGGGQVAAGIVVFAAGAYLLGYSVGAALLVGMAFSLSSTAMALQTLNERKTLNTVGGSSAFAILLFQDLAVIPMLAVLPLLGSGEASANWQQSLLASAKVVGVLVLVLGAGRLFLSHLFRIVANVHLRELFTALALLLVVGMGLLMESLHVSMGLGAFLAGLLLSESEYKHAIEADIEPFKGLFLGLFFMSVGMTVKASDILARPGLIALAMLAVMAAKLAIHYFLAVIFQIPRTQRPFFSLVIAQVGEFAFVLLGAAAALGILTEAETGTLLAVSALSFVTISIAIRIYDAWLIPYFEDGKLPADQVEDEGAPVIIAGFGRVGQIVGRFLFANGIKATLLDYEATQVESLRKFGFKVFYGDATREDLLAAAGAAHAKLLVVAIDDVESSIRLVDIAREHYPHLKIVCRARNVEHVTQLRARGITHFERETFDGSLRLGRMVLEEFGTPPHQAFSLAQKFRDFDLRLTAGLSKDRSIEARISLAQQARLDIEKLFTEENSRIRVGDEGWTTYDTER